MARPFSRTRHPVPRVGPRRRGALAAWRRLVPLVVAMLGASVSGSSVRAELLDRLVAVVGSRPILESDVRLVEQLSLVDVPAGAREGDTLARLIDRALMLDEVDRFGPGEPGAAEVDARIDALRARVGSDVLASTLQRTGVPEAALRGWVRDQVRLERYLAQRFDAVAQPTSDEVALYYADHPEEFTSAGVRRPLEDVEDMIQQTLASTRRAGLVADWQQALRRRARIRLLPAPEAPSAPG